MVEVQENGTMLLALHANQGQGSKSSPGTSGHHSLTVAGDTNAQIFVVADSAQLAALQVSRYVYIVFYKLIKLGIVNFSWYFLLLLCRGGSSLRAHGHVPSQSFRYYYNFWYNNN